MNPIYLDHAATTPLDPRVFEAMSPYFETEFGNPSSAHALGRKARFVIESCREKVAGLLGVEPGEIVFTSGGTESNNAAMHAAWAVKYGPHRRLAFPESNDAAMHAASGGVLTSTVEHESVLRAATGIRSAGWVVRLVDPGPTGAVSAFAVGQALDDAVSLVSIMHANNVVGTLSPVREIVRVCRERSVLFHCDAVQTVGYGLMSPSEIDVDLMTASGHKFHGPKGSGMLFVRSGVDLEPILRGGGQERGRRSGTENVPAVVGFTRALELALEEADVRRRHAEAMRDRLCDGVQAVAGARCRVVTPFGEVPVAPHIVHVVISPLDGVALDGEMLLLNLDLEGVCASAGSACASGAVEPSHVLTALGLDRDSAWAPIRFSVGKDTTEDEVDRAVEVFGRVLHRMNRKPVRS